MPVNVGHNDRGTDEQATFRDDPQPVSLFHLLGLRPHSSAVLREASLGTFDAVIAADVLEHCEVLDWPIRILREVTAPNGVLVTSLPTENFVYVALRWLLKIVKPVDHYHTGYEVERRLTAAGFRRLRTTRIPNGLTPLFLVTTWMKT